MSKIVPAQEEDIDGDGGSGLLPTRSKVTGIVAVSLFLAAVLAGSWLGLEALERQHREETRQSLEFVVTTTQELLKAWLFEEAHYLERWARDPQVEGFAERLLATARTQVDLSSSEAQQELRAYLRERDYRPGGMGFFIIAPGLISVASMRDTNIGTTNLIAQHRPEILQRVFAGETAFVPPIRSDVALPDADGKLREAPPTMFVATPIRGKEGGVVAVMTLRIDPARDFSRLCKLGRIGMSGETYAFDDDGRLMTESRFREDLTEIGLVGEGEHGVLSIRLSDPGGDLPKGYLPTQPQAEQPLTRMAAEAVAGRSGADVEGYRGYRGVRVLGAWVWDPSIGIGIATEVDEREVLATYHLYRTIVLSLLAVTALLAVLLAGFAVWSGERASRALGQVRDEWERIAEERTAELAESEGQFRGYFEYGQIGMAITSPEKGWLEVNDRLCEMLGYTLEELRELTWAELTHPDDLAPDVEQFGRLLSGEIDNYTLDKRFLRKDGAVLYTNMSVACTRNEDGSIDKVLASLLDITERQVATEELRKLSRAIEYSPVSVVVTDRNGNIEYVNPTFTEVSGYTSEEAIGQNPRILNSGNQFEEVYEKLWQTISSGEIWRGELCNKKKNGELFWESSSISPIANKEGEITHFVAVKEDITARREAQEALAELEERSRTLLESAGEGIFGVDLKGCVTFVNVAAGRLLGYAVGELMGTEIHPLIHHSRADGTSYPVDECPMRLAYTDGEPQHVDDEVLWRKDGTRFAVDYTATPIRKGEGVTGSVVTFRDITERKQAEIELIEAKEAAEGAQEEAEEKQQELLRLVNGLPLPTALFDPNGEVLAINQTFTDLLGYTAGDIPSVEAHWEPFYPDPVYREEIRADWTGRVQQSAQTGRPIEPMDLSITAKTREIYDLQAHTVQVGRLAATMWVDFTEKNRAARELLEAKEAADAANRSKSEFLANMSHEIRTPMNAILGFTEILSGLVEESQQRDYLRSIQASGKSLLSLINDILDLSKVEAGKLELEYEAINPRTIFEEMQAVFSQKLEEKGLDFIIEIDPELPGAIVLDETRLRQVLFNVIGNAIKFTHEGQIKLSVHNRYPDDNRSKLDLIFEIEDTGIGIPEEQIDRIFGAFEQQTGQSNREYGGTGLGLAITKRLVEMMNGEIHATSEVDKGTIFHVTLGGLAVASVADVADPFEAQIDVGAVSFSQATILVVDDIAANRAVVNGYLAPYGFLVLEAEDGEEGLRTMREHRPAFVLMDMKMPVMDGYEATQRAKEDGELKGIPIVALTASAMKQRAEEISELCDGYLRKPVTKPELVAELMRFLEHEVSEGVREQDQVSAEGDADAIGDVGAVGEGGGDELEPIDLPGLLTALREQEPKWRGLCQTQTINEIEAFGNDMSDLGQKHSFAPLIEWGKGLANQAVMFDLDGMMKRLEGFPAIGKGIESTL